jgi:hypothetical protein
VEGGADGLPVGTRSMPMVQYLKSFDVVFLYTCRSLVWSVASLATPDGLVPVLDAKGHLYQAVFDS